MYGLCTLTVIRFFMVHRLVPSSPCIINDFELGAGKYKVKGLTGGLPSTTALWNLKLALAYYSTSQAVLLTELGTNAGSLFTNLDCSQVNLVVQLQSKHNSR